MVTFCVIFAFFKAISYIHCHMNSGSIHFHDGSTRTTPPYLIKTHSEACGLSVQDIN